VLLVADSFDAMTSVRPYGTLFPPELALAELRDGAGRQFDAQCVEALAQHLAERPLPAAAKRFERDLAVRA